MKILIDSREKIPWSFSFHDVETETVGLKYGDYTTSLLQDKLAIERKASTLELFVNLRSKKEKTRFYKELDVLQTYECKYIICEFPESIIYEFPKKSGIPANLQSKIKVKGRALRAMIGDFEEKFDIPVIFCDDSHEAEDLAYSLMLKLENQYAGDIHTRGKST